MIGGRSLAAKTIKFMARRVSPNESSPFPAPQRIDKQRAEQEHVHVAGKIPRLSQNRWRVEYPTIFRRPQILYVKQQDPPMLASTFAD